MTTYWTAWETVGEHWLFGPQGHPKGSLQADVVLAVALGLAIFLAVLGLSSLPVMVARTRGAGLIAAGSGLVLFVWRALATNYWGLTGGFTPIGSSLLIDAMLAVGFGIGVFIALLGLVSLFYRDSAGAR